jgi:putative GTP pyrophosphokinase
VVVLLVSASIDRLGNRLEAGSPTEADLRLLEDFRRSFKTAYREVVGGIRSTLAVEVTGRPAKSTRSLVEKLRRESIRLSQMQDIAGCRLVVKDAFHQDIGVMVLPVMFANARVEDRRSKPNHGYRAVHVIATIDGKRIEIQLRTELQHQWAEWSEKCADVLDPAIKYGGGPQVIRSYLESVSVAIANLEELEGNQGRVLTFQVKGILERTGESADPFVSELRETIEALPARIERRRTELSQAIRRAHDFTVRAEQGLV